MKACLLLAIAMAWSVVPSRAQVSVLERTRPDATYSAAEIHIDTLDRSLVPMKTETTQTPLPNGGTRIETVTQNRLSTGAYFTSERAVTTTQKLAGDTTRSVSEVSTIDRQGQPRPARQVVETVTKHGNTETAQVLESRRNSSGELVPGRQIAETSQRQADGTTVTEREVREPDVNGHLVLTQTTKETIVNKGPQEQVTQSSLYSANHLTGALAETARETTVARREGNTTQTERLISQSSGVSWEVKTKVVSTETKTPNGAVERETIKYAKPLHDAFNPTSTEPLQPKLKIVEKTVTGTDGRTVMDREVYFRDVNNAWKPQSFSTDFGGSAERNYGRQP